MDHFHYKKRQGRLEYFAENVAIRDIVEAVGTPTYIYSHTTLRHHYNVFYDALSRQSLRPQIYFAMKANPNLSVLKTLAQAGAGMDILSKGEFLKAEAAGVTGQKIVFSGVGKTLDEIDYALMHDVYQINIESISELNLIAARAKALNKTIEVAIRVNPDVDAKTHKHISTGGKENKFGINIGDSPHLYQKMQAMEFIKPVAIAMHIGSQLTSLQPYAQALSVLADMVKTLLNQGVKLKRIDIGGGLGIPYQQEQPPSPNDYAAMVATHLGVFNMPIMLEPGRLIAGNAGILVSRLLFDKPTQHKRFYIIDAGMNDLMRPALYDAYHEILPVIKPIKDKQHCQVDIVGPVCESTDCFAKDRTIPPMMEGELLLFRSAGAYSAAMASTYNMRPLPAEIMVKDSEFHITRARQSYESLMAQDILPPFLTL